MVKKGKKILKPLKSKSNKNVKSKIGANLTLKNNKRKIKQTFKDKNEYLTDLSFIDKFEEEEKERLKLKENEALIKFLNKKTYIMKICYRPISNNIEFIGTYLQNEENNVDKTNKNMLMNNKCNYLLLQDNNIIVPILNEEILNINNKNKRKNNDLKEDEIKENAGEQICKKQRKKGKQFFYLHICKKNLIKCLLINEYSIINYILIFLSGNYSGYFEEKNKNNSTIFKVDSFHLILSFSNIKTNEELYNIEVFGKGKDEYGEYIIKGKLKLIHNIEQYIKENESININIKNSHINKIIYFGNISFHKNYNI